MGNIDFLWFLEKIDELCSVLRISFLFKQKISKLKLHLSISPKIPDTLPVTEIKANSKHHYIMWSGEFFGGW
ncbi:hypothetical protein [Desulfosarcina sp.]|uniref:hypothetical protein n=1 Tax=Desulfosarcina sp. TaxID=2027861 RepID=UPI0029A4538B|nr:hypothetical protein [Desulfosarcina sp.]MDX2451239.1 hypothetical protein [Desulfosarcina sp.]MDX2489069.1 hypothetical protein [Desulfosarcina sp.]